MPKHTPELIQPQLPFDKTPYGYCHCGCGEKTRPATRTRPDAGWIKGQPLRYLNGHYGREHTPTVEPNPSGMCLCGCGEPAPISQKTNPKFGHVAGKPVRFICGHHVRLKIVRPVEDRFWEKIDRRGTDECWDWQAGDDGHGYGVFVVADKKWKASRFAYFLTYGFIPSDLDCLHKCDRPPCCNPNHLFLGTAQDNHDDMMEKGRDSKPPRNDVSGEKNGGALFTNAQAAELRIVFSQMGISVTAFAKLHNVPVMAMWNLLHYKTYKNA